MTTITTLLDHEYEDVKTFHQKFDILVSEEPTHLTTRKLMERVDCLAEEVKEFFDAAVAQDLAKMTDALIDLVYFAKGTAVMMGLPWYDQWVEVHTKNMQKERGVGKRGHQVDVIKPPGWEPPANLAILLAHGYQPEKFFSQELGMVDEAKCLDDQRETKA